MNQCSNCGAELDAGAKFCMECGTLVPQVKKCVQCGKELPLRAKFCFGCGAPQEGPDSQMTGISGAGGNVEECRVANNKEENLSIGEGCSPVVGLDTLFASGK